MKYNFIKIGERIKKERKAHGFKSQDSLVNELKERFAFPITRQTLAKIEKGENNHYDCDLLFALCEIFDCEMGYLLCEYDTRYGREKDVAIDTGLSQEAATKLCYIKDNPICVDIFSKMIESDKFERLLITMNKAKSRNTINNTYAREIVNYVTQGVAGGKGENLFSRVEDAEDFLFRQAVDNFSKLLTSIPFKPFQYEDEPENKSRFVNATPTKQQLKNMALNGRSIQIGCNDDSATTGGITGGIESKNR